jgi:hypothetical protein
MAKIRLVIKYIISAGLLLFSRQTINTNEKINSSINKTCPPGFILVNGDKSYGTNDFCVMKYDAKCTNTNPKCVTSEGVYRNDTLGCACENNYQVVSTPAGAPITYIPEDNETTQSAKSYCQNAGWHLITNPEWMTIAKDVAEIPANWCNANGTGCGNPPGTPEKILANGHNDSSPARALISGPDNLPCFGTTLDGSNDCGSQGSQKRTLTLGSGEVIWDFAGNVWQWVDARIARKDEPHSIVPSLGGTAWVWAEFSTVPRDNNYSPSNPKWDSKMGVGRIYHYNLTGDTDTTLYTYIRGGNWRHGADSGTFTIHMQPVPGKTGIDDIGFRCVASPI